jgi:hypothetical protein
MRRFVLASALVTVFAVPAFANDQLARSLGVDPGVYSTPELVLLRSVRQEGDGQREKFIIGGGAEIVSTQSFDGFANSGNDQLARSLGVEPGMYSTPELVLLRSARQDGDRQLEKFILSGGLK